MTKTMKIEGIMCGHCEARVKKALEALEGVEGAEVSLEEKKAVLTFSAPVEDTAIMNAITEAGYTALRVE